MSDSDNWQASPLEQRIAWGIAASCIMLVLLSSVRPEWLDFSTSEQKTPIKQALSWSANQTATQQHKIHIKTRPAMPVRATKKPSAIHTKTKSKSPHHTEKKRPAIADGFYVQLGAFKQRLRAQGLADQLKRKGWAVVISTMPGGLHAVWVGPEKTRGEAEKRRKAIQRNNKDKGFIVHNKT